MEKLVDGFSKEMSTLMDGIYENWSSYLERTIIPSLSWRSCFACSSFGALESFSPSDSSFGTTFI